MFEVFSEAFDTRSLVGRRSDDRKLEPLGNTDVSIGQTPEVQPNTIIERSESFSGALLVVLAHVRLGVGGGAYCIIACALMPRVAV